MLKNINPTQTQAWKALTAHFESAQDMDMKELFAQDAKRFESFSTRFGSDILVDYSKNLIDAETMQHLFALANETEVKSAIEAMFGGDAINKTEGRSVLHTALRNRSDNPVMVDGKDVMPAVNAVLAKMELFTHRIVSGEWKGYTGKEITDVVNIGIGGSDLGPYMVTEALTPYKTRLNMHFVSNVDGTHIVETLKPLNP
ncbi:glucose-6-phosphate isomerase, partial [Vibrio splendidus]